MNPELFATWVLIGLLTGWVARIMMKDGGRGQVWDLAPMIKSQQVARS